MKPRDWLPPHLDPVRYAVLAAAHDDVDEMEEPGNRGAFPDACNRASGSPLGSPYCAGAVTKWFDAAGARRPKTEAGSCDAWRDWAKREGLWLDPSSLEVLPGDAVIYTNWKRLSGPPPRWDCVHMGVAARFAPARLAYEANTSSIGFSRDGLATLLKGINTPAVVGFVRCTAR